MILPPQAWPDTLRHFGPNEFCEWAPFMDHNFLSRLDQYRQKLGMPIMISPVNGALGRRNGKPTSQHYFDGTRYLRVADIMPYGRGGRPLDKEEMEYAVELARQLEFTGIGLYPAWMPYPGLHLDMRPGTLRTWGMLPIDGEQTLVSMAQAWRNWATYQA